MPKHKSASVSSTPLPTTPQPLLESSKVHVAVRREDWDICCSKTKALEWTPPPPDWEKLPSKHLGPLSRRRCLSRSHSLVTGAAAVGPCLHPRQRRKHPPFPVAFQAWLRPPPPPPRPRGFVDQHVRGDHPAVHPPPSSCSDERPTFTAQRRLSTTRYSLNL